MSRRVLEHELLAKEGKEFSQPGTPKALKIIKENEVHKTFRGVFSIQFNYNGELLVVGYGAGGIELYETTNGTLVRHLRPCRQGGHSVMTLRFHPKQPDILYAGTTAGEILIINVSTAELIQTVEERGNEIMTLDFCVDGYNFATGGRDLGIRIYETKSNKLVTNYEGLGRRTYAPPDIDEKLEGRRTVGNTMRIFAIKFHPDNQFIFVSGGWDNNLKIWDIRSNDGIKRNIHGPHICGESLDMKNNDILTGQWTALHALQEYNYTTGKVVRELKYPHTDGAFIYSAQYCNNNLVAAGGSGTHRAELVEISTNKLCCGYDLKAPIQALDSAQNGRLLSVGGASNKWALLKIVES